MSLVGTTSKGGFLAEVWIFTGVITILFIGRLSIRKAVQHRLYWDDFFAGVAFVLLIASSILYTVLAPYAFYEAAIIGGQDKPPSESDMIALELKVRKLTLPLQAFFWTGLWAVKFSFLFLYKLVLFTSKTASRIWYGVALFMLLTWGVMMIPVFGQCGAAHNLFNLTVCAEPYYTQLNGRLLWVEFAFVVFTDLIVIILPLPILWGLQMRISHKLAVTGVCCLALVCIAFDVLRTVEQYKGSLLLAILYTSLELEMSVLVVMLPPLRFMISNSDKSRMYRRRFLSIITLGSLSARGSDHSLERIPSAEHTKV